MGLLWNLNLAYFGTVGGQSGNYIGQVVSGSSLETLESHLGGKQMPVLHINARTMLGGTLQGFNATLKTSLDNIHTAGRIPLVTYGTWDLSNFANNFSLRPSRWVAGDWDSYLTTWMNEAKAWLHPILIRLPWEFNVTDGWQDDGNFPWCVGNIVSGGHSWTNTAADIAGMFQKFATIRDSVGATNVSFIWCPNVRATTGKTATAGALSQYWPGLRANGTPYMNWLGVDGYQDGYTGGSIGGSYLSLYQIMRGGGIFTDTWGEMLALSGAARMPIAICETNASLAMGRANRAAYWTEALNTSIPALAPNLGLLSLFWWNYGAPTNYAMDLSDTSPTDDVSPAVFVTSNADFQAFVRGLGGAAYPHAPQVTLPPDSLPMRPYALADQPDRFRQSIRSILSLIAYWRGQEASGNLADDTGNGHTATANGSPSYHNATVVPSNTSDFSIGRVDDTTTFFDAGDINQWSPAAVPEFSVIWCGRITALPTTGNAHLIAKGNTGAYEYSLYLGNTSGLIVWNFWNADASIGAAASSVAAIPTGVPVMIVAVYDPSHVAQAGDLTIVLNGNTASKFTAGLGGLALTNGTAPLYIGRRADATRGPNGSFGHVAVLNRALSDRTIQELYAAWQPAPVISAVHWAAA
jgi:hypothetical protein